MNIKTNYIAILLFFLLILFSFSDIYSYDGKGNMRTEKKREIKTYLALGDSYTIAESVSSDMSYPVILAGLLNNKGYKISPPVIIAKTGWTTEELMAGIDEKNIKSKKFDLVTLLIGVNDQYRGYELNKYPERLEKLIKIALDFAGRNKNKIIIISIPDWGITPFAKSKGRDKVKIGLEIDQYNLQKKLMAEKYSIKYVDVTDISRRAVRKPNLIAGDGLHPSGLMYSLWAEKLLSSAEKVLKKND